MKRSAYNKQVKKATNNIVTGDILD